MRADDAWKITLAFTSTALANTLATLALHAHDPCAHARTTIVMLITGTITSAFALLIIMGPLRKICHHNNRSSADITQEAATSPHKPLMDADVELAAR